VFYPSDETDTLSGRKASPWSACPRRTAPITLPLDENRRDEPEVAPERGDPEREDVKQQ
jgi:hypothetical protein